MEAGLLPSPENDFKIYHNTGSQDKADTDKHPDIEVRHTTASYWQRWGFFKMITTEGAIKETLKSQLINTQSSQQKSDLELLEKAYEADMDRYDLRIEQLYTHLGEIQQMLLEYEKSAAEDLKLKTKIEGEVNELEESIFKHIQDFGERKSSLISDRIDQVAQELDKLISTVDSVSDQKQRINQKTFELNKEVLKEEATLFKRFCDHYQQAFVAIEQKIIKLNQKGINHVAIRFLNGTGLSASVLAGWFFSIFSSQRGLNSDGWLFFILESLLNFTNSIKDEHSLSNAIWILSLVIGLLSLLLVVFGISWGTKRLVEVIDKKSSNQQTLVLGGTYEEFITFKKELRGSSFLSFWLQLLPIVFTIGVCFILIQSGSSTEGLRSLDTSLSGQLAGSVLALVIGGLGFYFVSYIFGDPKIKANESQGNAVKRLEGKHILLIVLLTVFIASIIGLYVFSQKGAGALLGFVACCLLTGFLLGYGIRYKGLLQTRDELEQNLRYFKYKIKSNSRPVPIYLTSSENKVFKDHFLRLEQEILELLVLKTQQIKNIWPKPFWKINKYRRLPKWLFYLWFWDPSKRRDLRKKISMSASEEVQFPKEKEILENLQHRLSERDQDLEEVSKRIEDMAEQKTGYHLDKGSEKLQMELEIRNISKYKTDRMKQYRSQKNRLLEEHGRAQTALSEGIELGNWFLAQQNKPTQ